MTNRRMLPSRGNSRTIESNTIGELFLLPSLMLVSEGVTAEYSISWYTLSKPECVWQMTSVLPVSA